ncbi:MAG TPA: hypothetical protein VFA12_07950 [Stellaceae bacterium]|nr:hypothetical protein [Stellaceae bacterium]
MIRMFMSTDVAGSTAFKASSSGKGDGTGWLDVFRAFFSSYPIMVMGQVGMEFLDEDTLPEVAVWKFMGDEAIFTCKPSSPEEVTLLVRAHFNAMAAYEQEYLADLPLRLKGTAWLARFPSPNIEVEVPELAKDVGTTPTDFIGPDIDLGFRITKFASPSAVAVSLDLLDVVLRADNRDLLDFYLVGREELKGVLFGRPYPVVWARASEAPPGFMPWEIDDSPMVAKAVAEGPTAPAALNETIDAVRLYLRKMHGAARPPLVFDRPPELKVAS